MGVKLQSKKIEKITVECDDDKHDQLIIEKSAWGDTVNIEAYSHGEFKLNVNLSPDDVKALGEALITMAEQDDE